MVKILDPKERDSVIIKLEGGEGSGKTTVDRAIRTRLTKLGLRVMPQLKEPGSTPRAELLRITLKNVIDTPYSLPSLVRTGFNLEEFAERISQDHLSSYAKINIAMVMSQLSPLDIKYGILEYVINGGFDGLPFDTYDRMSFKAQLYRQGKSKQLNPLYQLVKKLTEEMGIEKNVSTEILTYFGKEKLTAEQQARLFFAARNLLHHNIIGPCMHKEYLRGEEQKTNPSLGEFDCLILDRSGDSTVVYQGHAQDPSRIEALRAENIKATEGILSDLTLYLDVSPEIGIARTRKTRGIVGDDFFDSAKLDFHERVRAGYRAEISFYANLPRADPQYGIITEINAHGTPDQVENLVWSTITERIGPKLERIKKLRK